jgi:hypothetical protein
VSCARHLRSAPAKCSQSALHDVATIDSNQTPRLLEKFKGIFPAELAAIGAIQRVIPPENIHLNSCMYEPIIDMSDEHLRKLYAEVLALT